MSAISAPSNSIEFISKICDRCEQKIRESYKINQVVIKIFAESFVQKDNKLVCSFSYEKPIIHQFTATAFDKDAYSADLVERFKKIKEELLKKGCFVKMKCKAAVESIAYIGPIQNPGNRPIIFKHTPIKIITCLIEGYINSLKWEKNFGSTEATASQTQQESKEPKTQK